MASVTMMASFLSGGVNVRPAVNPRRSLVVAKAAAAEPEGQDVAKRSYDGHEDKGSSGRRAVMFAAAAAAAICVGSGQGIAFAGEAKKPCVNTPRSRICRN